jgi:hypothetical protein
MAATILLEALATVALVLALMPEARLVEALLIFVLIVEVALAKPALVLALILVARLVEALLTVVLILEVTLVMAALVLALIAVALLLSLVLMLDVAVFKLARVARLPLVNPASVNSLAGA